MSRNLRWIPNSCGIHVLDNAPGPDFYTSQREKLLECGTHDLPLPKCADLLLVPVNTVPSAIPKWLHPGTWAIAPMDIVLFK